MKKLRIFISSPGDVQQERMIAKRVISDLSRVYQDYVILEPILWEDLPLEATGSFQGGIDFFLNQYPIDIAVFILWSRLGTKLGSSFRRNDGSEYDSGTEYEFDMMYTLWQRTKQPKIMVYVKDSEPQFVGSSSHIKELLEQKDKLDHFIEEKFKDRETGTNYAYWQFDKQQTFEERLRVHLTRLIKDQIGSDVLVREWEGNPYVGLRSYTMAESSIFCGRKGLIYDIVGKLLANSEDGEKPTLFVLGESGSGKSSLIKAGVLPQLVETSSKGESFSVEILTPSSFRGHIYNGLVDLVLKYFPSLKSNPVASDLQNQIPDNYDFKYLRHALAQDETTQVPIVFIDQFEELFTDNLITDEERKHSLHLLRGLCETRQIIMLFSMRNDFYSRFTSYPELGLLKSMSLVVDIPNVSPSDIAEIVEEPARKVNKRWARDENGISLSKIIIEEAVRLQTLPLIEFALSELYKECTEADEMTFEAYSRIGYLKGAVVQYADNFFSSLSPQEQEAFRSILGAVITVSNDRDAIFVRKTSVRTNIEKTSLQKGVIQKLIDAHLFISDKDSEGNPTISFVHEILLSSWEVVKDWCQEHKDFLANNDHYEKLARYWKTNGKQKKDLIQERSALLEAEYFMFHHEKELQPTTLEFLDKSLVKQRRKGIVKHVFYLISTCSLTILMVLGMFAKKYGLIDADFKEFIDYDSLSWYDVVSLSIPLLIVSTHSLFLRIRGHYKYKTIRSTTLLWSILLFVIVSLTLYEYFSGRTEGVYGLLWSIPFALCGASVYFEFQRRSLWKKYIYKPYLIADKYETTKSILLWSFVGLFGLFLLILYTAVLFQKNERIEDTLEKYETTLNVADDLFNGLNNIGKQLSWSDNQYINEKRKNYLIERFSEELSDTIPDERERQYATCLYNLYEPFEALKYLYPDNYWPDHCLYVLASAKAGLDDLAEFALEKYVEGRRLNDMSWVTPTQLVWTAEKLGRFDLADSIYSIMRERNIDWTANTADVSNYGHILLMNGLVSDAISCYTKANDIGISQNALMKETVIRNQVKRSLTNDFSTMCWLEVGNQDYINEAARKLGIIIRSFYTSVADSSTTEQIHEKLIGTWALSDSSIVISIHPKVPICQYKVFKDGNEIYRGLTNCRFSKINGHTFWEELNQETEYISSGEITSLSEIEFSVKIVDNGNDTDKGSVRTYHRVTEKE